MPRRKSTKKTKLREKVAEKRANLNTQNSYKSLFYGIATVIILFIIGFGAIKLLINRPKPVIDNQAVSIQNLTLNGTSSTEEVIPTDSATVTSAVTPESPPSSQGKITNDEKTKSKIYMVKEGESLWDIATYEYKDGYKWTQIAKANNIQNPSTIFKGDKLVIPQEEITPTPMLTFSQTILDNGPKSETSVGGMITGSTYVVKRGDDLWDIAVRAYGDGYKWVEIARLNNLSNPDLIHSDNILKLPR